RGDRGDLSGPRHGPADPAPAALAGTPVEPAAGPGPAGRGRGGGGAHRAPRGAAGARVRRRPRGDVRARPLPPLGGGLPGGGRGGPARRVRRAGPDGGRRFPPYEHRTRGYGPYARRRRSAGGRVTGAGGTEVAMNARRAV